MMYLITYECPDCGHEWQEVYDTACDSECPECNTGSITPKSFEDAEESADGQHLET